MYDFCIIINHVPIRDITKLLDSLYSGMGNNSIIQVYTDNGQYGKEKYYQLVTINFNEYKPAKLYIKLDDDVELVPDFFNKCKEAWDSIADNNKLTLNLLKDFRCEMWGSEEPKHYNHLVNHTGWTDGIFMFDQRFLNFFKRIELLPPPPYVKSSGVFRQISRKLRRWGGMYQVKQSLVFHGDHQSIMNPERKEKWIR